MDLDRPRHGLRTLSGLGARLAPLTVCLPPSTIGVAGGVNDPVRTDHFCYHRFLQCRHTLLPFLHYLLTLSFQCRHPTIAGYTFVAIRTVVSDTEIDFSYSVK